MDRGSGAARMIGARNVDGAVEGPAVDRSAPVGPGAPPAARAVLSPRMRVSLDVVWLAIVAGFAFIVLNFAGLPVDDSDLWWTLVLGRATWESGALPTVDPLAYTPTP